MEHQLQSPGSDKTDDFALLSYSPVCAKVVDKDLKLRYMSKAGIEAMIRNAADENGVHKVRFNAIRPGFIATEIMAGIPRDGDVFRSYVENTPLGDVGEPADVGQLARFLVGPESRWITGQCINVDGGHSLRRGPDFTSFKG